jgi:hypothetical protein
MGKGWIWGLAAAGLLSGANAQEQAASTTGNAEVHNAAAAVPLTPGAAEVVRLAQSGVEEDVVLAYVQRVTEPFNLSADNIVFLRDLGISSPVLTEMLNRDKEIMDKAATQPALQQVAQPVMPETIPPATEFGMVPPAQLPYPMPDASYVGSPPVEVSYFYNDLSPYGSWVVLPSYGWCWQPSVVVLNHGWRPYCDAGRWVCSTAGWCWQSDYSWGWAPFHYGRWMQHPNCGWVWFPDTAWSPAWVTWRVAGDQCGWAPMPWRSTWDARNGYRYNGVNVGVGFDFGLKPDCFTFVGLNNFCSTDLRRHCLPPTQVTQVFAGTTVLNNFSFQNNQTIVNGGISVERVSRATGMQLRPVAVQVDRGDFKGGRGGGPGVVGGPGAPTAPVLRRELVSPARVTPIVAERLDERQPVMRHPELAAMNLERRNPAMEMPGGNGRRGSFGGDASAVSHGPVIIVPANQNSYPMIYGSSVTVRGRGTATAPGQRQGGVPGMNDPTVLESPKDRSQRSNGERHDQRGSVSTGSPNQPAQRGGSPVPQTSRGQTISPNGGGDSAPLGGAVGAPRSGIITRPADVAAPRSGDPSRGR